MDGMDKMRRVDAIAEIDGLEEIKAAMSDLAKWNIEFEKSFDECGGLGVRPKPKYDIPAMRKQYPRADAYLKAEKEAYSSNAEISSIGRKALNEVIFGDWQAAMEQMERDIDDFVSRHIWD